MIVTRQRKQKKSALPVLLPIAAIAMLVVAATWPPSRTFILNSPARPVFDVMGNIVSTITRPLSFAYQQQQITDRNVQIKQLNDKLEADRKATDDKDAQISSLQKQVQEAQNQPDAGASPEADGGAPAAPAAAVAAAPAAPGAGAESPQSDALHRIAQQWSAMDPERAAALAQKLPEAYDAAVFAQMSPDNVGPIMDALPPAFAAKIVWAGPNAQVSAQTGR